MTQSQTMYCDKCNVEFTEGLRYCKWCGQGLSDRPRVTSELHACPNCASVVKPGWVFCKSCGVRLATPVGDPERIFCPECGAAAEASAESCARCGTSLAAEPDRSAHEAQSTSIIGSCPSCGEKLDTGSMYCKSCGAAVYAQARPFGGSAFLCGACNSYSPIGSTVCRVCGAPLGAEAGGGIAEQKQPTLLDLPSHLSESAPQPDADQVNSGANTAIFSGSDQETDPTTMLPAGDRGTHLVGDRRSEGHGTNALPGVAGSKSEIPARTARVAKTRITSPVEEEGEKPSSAELPPAAEETLLMHSLAAPPSREPQKARSTRSDGSPEALASPDHGETVPFSQGQPVERVVTDFAPAAPSAPLAEPQPPPTKRGGVAIASVAVAVIIVAGAIYLIWWFVGSRGTPTPRPQPPPVAETKPATPPPAPPAPVVPAGMVMVKAGAYTVGREDGDPLAAPGHSVTLPAFYIDRTEVTNAQYAKFVEATKRKPPSNWKGSTFPAGRDDYPVTGVTWQDAADYAASVGKRLPTESEWEAAARGNDSRRYPWGNEWQAGFANIGVRTAEKVEANKYPSSIAEVGKYPQGASPSGAVDMIGNVWEWVADEITLYPGSGATLPVTDDPAATLRVIRGGAYDGDQKHDASYRGYLDGSLPYPKVGFRCVKSASSP
jgi:formylglycine-generating enzyme required for sulfatase activity